MAEKQEQRPRYRDDVLYCTKMECDAFMPYRQENSIGYDLRSGQGARIPPGQTRTIGTNIAIKLPAGTYGRIAPRSGLAANHNIGINGGVIDPDYAGEISIVMINHGRRPFDIYKGDTIAQLICEKVAVPQIEEVPLLEYGGLHKMHPRTTGFGSTDQISFRSRRHHPEKDNQSSICQEMKGEENQPDCLVCKFATVTL